MGSIKMIEKDETVYCEKTGKEVNIHSLIHPILKVCTTRTCDNQFICTIENCEYKTVDE